MTKEITEMAKKKASEAQMPSIAPYSPPTRIKLTKEQAGDFSIGDSVKISVAGKVIGINATKNYQEGKDVITGYEVELDKSSVVDIQTNPAARSLREMKGE